MLRHHSLLLGLVLALVVPSISAAAPSITGQYSIGSRPVAVAVSRADHRVFVADAGLGAVIEFDGARNSITATIEIGGQPANLAMDDPGGRLFVGSRDARPASISVVDLATRRARAFLSGGRRVRGMAFDPEIDRLYAGDPDAGELLVIDGTSAQILDRLPLGGVPVSITLNEASGEVAVAVQGTAPSLALFDPADRAAGLLHVPVQDGQPVHAAADSATEKFFVTRGGANPALLVLRPGSNRFDNTIPIAAGVTGLAIDARTSRIYLGHATTDLATVVDGASGTPVALLPLDDGSNHVAVDPSSTPTKVYVAQTGPGLLSVLTDQ